MQQQVAHSAADHIELPIRAAEDVRKVKDDIEHERQVLELLWRESRLEGLATNRRGKQGTNGPLHGRANSMIREQYDYRAVRRRRATRIPT
jgi:hypothetical protein